MEEQFEQKPKMASSKQKPQAIVYGDSKFDIQFAVCKEGLEGPEEEKDRILFKRLVKFFQYGQSIDPRTGRFCARRQPNYSDPNTKILDSCLILFGIDFISTRKLRQIYKPVDVVVINHSNIKLIYKNDVDAFTALKENSKDQNQFNIKVEEEFDLPKGWIDQKPYYFQNIMINIQARYATSLEQVIEFHRERTADTYDKCKNKYIKSEKQKEQQNANREVIKRSRLEGRRRPNRQGSRERSREKLVRVNKNYDDQLVQMISESPMIANNSNLEVEINDQASISDSSNLSFFMSQSKKDIKDMMKINDAINGINFDSNSISQKLSVFQDGQLSNAQIIQNQNQNLSISNSEQQKLQPQQEDLGKTKSEKWNYQEYIKQTQQKSKKIQYYDLTSND